ncbi:NAD-dependent epimerase/dehydratase family protein [Alienimonas californiensis]|uniref:NAD dependent epimerase/dehydratase family protein n=1 Tax=Alienimonas californiensis TaxID=2527989 RepID=A0A517P4K0_9PLAN|nr:NAD(P)-dependent oxidoreductase [Alienimonas californiensis]QDT14276.1 NAD dependent epimerase/dehydratase family protein [Alienimonas californiensis]
MELPDRIADETALEELLSRPTPAVVDVFRRLRGDLAVLGSGGKMGLSLVTMACRARDAAGSSAKVFSVSRFGDAAVRRQHEAAGAETVACDLLAEDAADRLPPAAHVVYMVGLKFGTAERPDLTWAANTVAPLQATRAYRDADVVAFSTGNVYDVTAADSGGSVETDALEPRGEYPNAAVARERLFEYASRERGTPAVLLRLNYALEPRYGVLVDLAQRIAAGTPIDLATGYFNGIWQGDANAAALRLLEHAGSPPLAINVTGTQTLAVRDVATRLAERMGRPVAFTGEPAPAALLSNAARATALLGEPDTPIERVIDWVADWIARGGRTLGKPTRFEVRDGRY